MKPRLLVLTDISSLTQRLREPDDAQSMVRLMLYSNEIDIEGLLATSNLEHGQTCRPELIETIVKAYGQVRDSLICHDPDYPPFEQLLAGIHGGQPIAGPKTPVEDSLGVGKDTTASEWIQQVVRREDLRPLWISVWGGAADLAQALWRLRQNLTETELTATLRRLRIHAVNDQDSTAEWIKSNFPTLYYITRHFGIRGMYRGGDTSLVSTEWVEENIRNGHGALGAVYQNYDGRDIWSDQYGPVRGVKEGDTPSYLGLINNGLNPFFLPDWGSWGGRMQLDSENPFRYVDAVDNSLIETRRDFKPEMSATHRWRPAFQNDFAARLDWCVNKYKHANHAPRAKITISKDSNLRDGALQTNLRSGEWLELDASDSNDPDGDQLSFHWWVYPEPGSYRGEIRLEESRQAMAHLQAPTVDQPLTLHLILTVTDSGQPPLCHYQRIVIGLTP